MKTEIKLSTDFFQHLINCFEDEINQCKLFFNFTKSYADNKEIKTYKKKQKIIMNALKDSKAILNHFQRKKMKEVKE